MNFFIYKTKNKSIFYTFIFFIFFNIYSSTIIIKNDAEPYEIILFEFLKKVIDEKNLSGKKIGDFTNRKSKFLNLNEASCLYLLAMKDKKFTKQVQTALERIYSLSPNALLSELVLWNLAMSYEKEEKFNVAAEMFGYFRKLFPGSNFYWTSRYKEIKNNYMGCKSYYNDTQQIEFVIELCNQYIKDIKSVSGLVYVDVIYILQDLSMRMIKKEIENIRHYLNKYTYMKKSICIFSGLQRYFYIIYLVENIICNESIYENNELEKDYRKILKEINILIKKFFEIHPIIIPEGKDYRVLYDQAMNYIDNNLYLLKCDLYKDIDKIDSYIDVYYGLVGK
jgi:hypothetical protein